MASGAIQRHQSASGSECLGEKPPERGLLIAIAFGMLLPDKGVRRNPEERVEVVWAQGAELEEITLEQRLSIKHSRIYAEDACLSAPPMTKPDLTRRTFLKGALLATSAPLLSPHDPSAAARLTVVCVGGHPDDAESGCGGTLSLYAARGAAVTVIYLTRGERGIPGKSLADAASIRTAECDAACKIMGAKPIYFGQIDGATEVTRAHVDAMTQLLTTAKPDVVFTHWPVDTHMDHQVASMLTIRAWMGGAGAALRTSRLYFFEVNSGSQTEGFLPNTYVDVSSVVEQKKAALFAHVSQDGQGIWREHHEIIAQWRGREAGVPAAEAFVHLNRDTNLSNLPAT